ncbi:addiction module antidote protein [Treponema denticola]|nr:addiction module antidote protein [Treponema denticola]
MKISKWDAADYLKTRKDIAIYLDEILKIARADDTPELFIEALGDVTRAQGMTDLAKTIDVSRESLYKSLSKKGNPSFSTIFKVLEFLNLEMSITAPKTLKQVSI